MLDGNGFRCRDGVNGSCTSLVKKSSQVDILGIINEFQDLRGNTKSKPVGAVILTSTPASPERVPSAWTCASAWK
jgi:hypothetical protein